MMDTFNLSDLRAAPQDSFSLADLPPPKPSTRETALSAMKDLGVGLVDWPVQIAMQAGGDIGGAAYAALHPGATSAKEILQRSNELAGKMDPIARIADHAYTAVMGKPSDSDNPVAHIGQHIGTFVDTMGQHLEEATKGAVPKEAFGQLFNAASLEVPHIGVKLLGRAVAKVLAKKPIVPDAQAHIDALVGEGANGPTPKPASNEDVQRVKNEIDKHRDIQTKAYELMQKGASKKEVERALKADKTGALAQEMENIRARRAMAAESFDRDFGARQGEVLPAEEPPKGGPTQGGYTYDQMGDTYNQLGRDTYIPGGRTDDPLRDPPNQGGNTYEHMRDTHNQLGWGTYIPRGYNHDQLGRDTHNQGGNTYDQLRDTHNQLGAPPHRLGAPPHRLEMAPEQPEDPLYVYHMGDALRNLGYTNFGKSVEKLNRFGIRSAKLEAQLQKLATRKQKLEKKAETDIHPEDRYQAPRGAEPRKVTPRDPQTGSIDPKLAIGLGVVVGGAFTASQLAHQNKLDAAIMGGLTGAAVMALPHYVENLKENWSRTLRTTAATAAIGTMAYPIIKEHPTEAALLVGLYGLMKNLPKGLVPQIGRLSIDDMINLRNGGVRVRAREVARVTEGLKLAVPDKVRRGELARFIENGETDKLQGNEAKFVRIYRNFMNSWGEAARDEGVIKGLIENYVTHIGENLQVPKSSLEKLLAHLFDHSTETVGPTTKSRFSLARKYKTFDDFQGALERLGMQVKTMDPAEIVTIYGRSMGQAIENKQLVNNLQVAKSGDTPLIVPSKRAPPNYKYIDSPVLRGMLVHPDLEEPLRFALEKYRPGRVGQDLLTLTMAQKRLATVGSFFHLQNLGQAYMSAVGPLRGVSHMAQDWLGSAPSPIRAALQTYYRGSQGDVLDYLLQGGLEVASHLPTEFDPQALSKLGSVIDSYMPVLGMGEKVLGGLEKAQQHIFDKVTWDYAYTGMKLAVGLREMEKVIRKETAMRGTMGAEQLHQFMEKMAPNVASYANDIFGGQDWYRLASETHSEWVRRRSLSLLSPRGRTILQPMIFALDWSMSTFRSIYKALPGATEHPLTAKLHQNYVMRSALTYMTLLNGINIMTSGHPIWDNKNPYQIEYRDGSTQTLFRHATEFYQWLAHPEQTAQNKLGYVPREMIAQSEMPKGMGLGAHINQALKSALPISIQGGSAQDEALSILGMSVHKRRKKRSELLPGETQ